MERFNSLSDSLSRYFKRPISANDVSEALFMLWSDEKELEIILELWSLDFELDEAQSVLQQFDFDQYFGEIYTDIEVIEDIMSVAKVLVKSNGVVWKIHRYDKDPFPSNPHAHQVQANIKLDLSNGNCYRRKEYLKTIPVKELLKIRDAASKVFKGNLPPLYV